MRRSGADGRYLGDSSLGQIGLWGQRRQSEGSSPDARHLILLLHLECVGLRGWKNSLFNSWQGRQQDGSLGRHDRLYNDVQGRKHLVSCCLGRLLPGWRGNFVTL
jgi:hypothetical protein